MTDSPQFDPAAQPADALAEELGRHAPSVMLLVRCLCGSQTITVLDKHLTCAACGVSEPQPRFFELVQLWTAARHFLPPPVSDIDPPS